MLETSLTLFRFNQEYFRLLVADLNDANFDVISFPGGKSPRWIVGHLTICNDFGIELLGGQRICPVELHAAFGPGSDPTEAVPKAIGRADLIGLCMEGFRQFEAAVPMATPEQLAPKHRVPMKQLLRFVPTVGDLVAHLMTTHIATHLGQLSVWRRQQGLPEVF